ncbi:hypothetical protein B0H13DRAFT_1878075 [Mycena leptocephala]|nr:hypothetical protein B0H13DRAFT_1878075 [Mycena leptocephala]
MPPNSHAAYAISFEPIGLEALLAARSQKFLVRRLRLCTTKEHGAVKWSTDPSQTAGTYLRNLLPDQGRVFRQLQARSTETVRKHIGGSARNLLPEQGEVFRQLRPVSRQVRSTETVRKHIGGSARNLLPEQGGVFKQLQVRSTETIRKHIGGSARHILPEQGKVVKQLRPVSRQVRSTETVRKHIGGSARNVLPEQERPGRVCWKWRRSAQYTQIWLEDVDCGGVKGAEGGGGGQKNSR